MFQFEILGIFFIKEQLENILLISVTLDTSQFEISGKFNKLLHPEKILFILVIFAVFQLEIPLIFNNEEQSENIKLISVNCSFITKCIFLIKIFENESLSS